jgi:TP901 family phage tail tape measure protein
MTRIGASQVFFNVVAQWNADKMIQDSKTQMTVMKAVVLDSFEAMMKPVDEFTMGLNNMVQELSVASQALGMAQVEFEKFFGSDNIESATDELMAIGEAYATVGHEALTAGSRAAQVANLIGKENVDLLVEQANILSNISDLNAEQAQRGIIQLQQQTGLLYGQRSRAQFQQLSVMEKRNVLTEQSAVMLDTLNTIANRSVAMEGDLVKTLSNFAAQGNLVGESFHFMAAASATLLEAGEEQGASGRALRMMYARLGGNISGTRDKLEAMGIATKDANGELLTMEQFMKGLIDGGYKQLNSEQKQNIAQVVSGNRHYVRFIKLMENYDRVTQLAADGAERLDSAQTQSARALETQTMELEKQRAIQENLQAKMGQQMTPFMIGQLQASNRMNEAYAELMDVMPTFGNILGRLVGSFEKFEGFLKFSIGLQSMAIGFEMMDSVQRSLHGILIANENLHSKQATYMESGVQASVEQNQIMNAIRYQSQLVNTLQERIRMAKNQQLVIDQTRLPNLERQAQLTKDLAIVDEERTILAQKQSTTEFNLKTLTDRRLNDHTKINRMILQDVDYAKELAATFRAIDETGLGPMSVTQERLASQMLVNSKVANDLSEEQTRDARDRVATLREEHTVMQMLKAENQAAYQLRSGQGTGTQTQLAKAFSFDVNSQSRAFNVIERELQRVTPSAQKAQEAIDALKKEISDGAFKGDALKAANERLHKMKDRAKDASVHVQGLEEVQEALNNTLKGGAFQVSAKGMHAFTKIMKQQMGEMIEITKILDAQTVKEMDLATIQERRAQLSKSLTIIDEYRGTNMDELQQITADLNLEEKEHARLQNIITDAITERVSVEQTKQRLIDAMAGGIDTLNAADQARVRITEELTLAQEKHSQSSKRMTMQFTSLVSVLGGMGGFGLSGAMTTALMQFSMFIPVLQNAKDSVAKYIETQRDLLILEEGVAFHRTKAGKQLMMMTAKIAAVVAVMYTYTYFKEKELKLQKEINAVNESQLNAFNRMTTGGDEMLIQNQELAELLGIQGVKLKDLRSDEELRLRVTRDLTSSMKDFTGENRNAVEEALALATAVGALNTGMSQLVDLQMQQTRAAGHATGESFFGIPSYFKDISEKYVAAFDEHYDFFYDFDTQAKKQRRLFEQMADDLDQDFSHFRASYNERIELVEDYIQHISAMEEPVRLTADELDLLSESFDNAAVDSYIRGLNNAILSTGDLALMSGHLDGEFGAVQATIGATSVGLENLTEEIHQFSGAREELFFGGKYGNVTGSLYKQVVTQGVGTLYNKNEVIVSNNFHGFFNEQEAADKIIGIVTNHLATV